MACPFHQDDGGHAVHGGVSFPIEATECGACIGGICRCGLACFMPEPDPQLPKRRVRLVPATHEGWGRVIGAVLGLGGFALFGRELLLRLFT